MQELKFHKIDGTPITDVKVYVHEWAKNNPYGKIIVGCDSQTFGRRIKYSVVIVMHIRDKYGMGSGAHVIVASVWDKRNNKITQLQEMPSKLWKESEYLFKALQMLDEHDEVFKKKLIVHLDYNSVESEKSNQLYLAGMGFFKGLGYNTFGKPHSYVATHTADHFCR